MKRLSALALLTTLAACGGGGGGGGGQPPPPGTFTIGGTVSGLSGSGLVLRNNGGNDLAVTGNGAFTFTTSVSVGGTYAVTVATQPSGQQCTVAGGSGTAAANVNNVVVSCVNATTFAIGGTVNGLTGAGLVLQNNGGDDLPVSASGAFTFTTRVASGSPYAVTVATQPSGQNCTVADASGSATADVTTVAVTCSSSAQTFSIGGVINNLTSAGLILKNNNGVDTLTVSANATSFTFPTRIAPGAGYAVEIVTQPNTQDCTIANGSGTANADVNSVIVSCGDMAPFGVTATSPADGATAVPRNAPLSVTFSAPLNPTSVAGVHLMVDVAEVNVTKALSGGVLTLTPSVRLLPNKQHRIVVDPTVRSVRDQTLVQGVTHTFTTASQSWKDAKIPSGNEVTDVLREASVAMDSAGNALAAWVGVNSLQGISVSRYDVSTGSWSTPDLLTGDTGVTSRPQLAMDAAGNALLVWEHFNTALPFSFNVVFASRFSAATGSWEAPQPISHVDGSHGTGASIAVEPNGDIAVVWKRRENGTDDESIWMNRTNTSLLANWIAPGRVDVDGGGIPVDDAPIIGKPVVAFRAGTRIVVAWSRRRSPQRPDSVIWAQVYQNGLSPSPDLVSQPDGFPKVEPQLVMDREGNTILVWRDSGGAFSSLFARAANSVDGAWGTIFPVSDATNNAFKPRLETNRAATGESRTVVSWVWPAANATGKVKAAFLDFEGRPSELSELNLGPRFAFDMVNLAVDASANVLAVWSEQGTTNLMSSRYDVAGGGWGVPVPLGTGLESGANIGALAVNPIGDMVVVWPDATGHNVREATLRSRHFE